MESASTSTSRLRAACPRQARSLEDFSAADPAFYRIYRGEQAVDLLRSANTGVNRVQTVTLKAAGAGRLANPVNGTEKIIAQHDGLYRRNTFLP